MMKMKWKRCCFPVAMVQSLGYIVDCVVVSVGGENEAKKVLFSYGYSAVIEVIVRVCVCVMKVACRLVH